MSVSRRYTVAEVAALPYDEWLRYELIDGELHVSEPGSWMHQHVIGELIVALNWRGKLQGPGFAISAPGLILSTVDAVIPDVIWVSWERLRACEDQDGHLTAAPELVVEVVSPGAENVRRDCELKLNLYAREGVGEYWIVDWQRQTVEVYRPANGRLEGLAQTLTGEAVLESPLFSGLKIPVSTLWPPTL